MNGELAQQTMRYSRTVKKKAKSQTSTLCPGIHVGESIRTRTTEQGSFLFNILLVGDSASGKSTLLYSFAHKHFCLQHCVTVGVELGSGIVDVAGRAIKLTCWDTVGAARFRSIVRTYYEDAAGALLVYDITRRETFDDCSYWIQKLKAGNPETVVMLLGNMSDVAEKRQVSFEEGRSLADMHGLRFLETSAYTGSMVNEAFLALAKVLYIMNRHVLEVAAARTCAQCARSATRQDRYKSEARANP